MRCLAGFLLAAPPYPSPFEPGKHSEFTQVGRSYTTLPAIASETSEPSGVKSLTVGSQAILDNNLKQNESKFMIIQSRLERAASITRQKLRQNHFVNPATLAILGPCLPLLLIAGCTNTHKPVHIAYKGEDWIIFSFESFEKTSGNT